MPEPRVPVETIRDEDINLGKNWCTIVYNQTIKNHKNNYDYNLLLTLLKYQTPSTKLYFVRPYARHSLRR